MEGALESAEYAAKLVIQQLRETSGTRYKLEGTELQQLLTTPCVARVPPIGNVMNYVYAAVDAIDEWQPRLRAPMLGAIAVSWYFEAGDERLVMQMMLVAVIECIRLILCSLF
jgi:hypothetical protein